MGEIRQVTISEGVEVSSPFLGFLAAGRFVGYADDAAFVTAKGSAAAEKDVYYNTTDDVIKYYDGSAWNTVATINRSETITGAKTFNAILSVANTTDSTNKDTGALVIEGGLGVEKNANIGGNLTILGNLTVQGTQTILNTETLDVEDPEITVNKGGNDASAEGSGIKVERTGTHGALRYKGTARNKFTVGPTDDQKDVAVVDDIPTTFIELTDTPAAFTGQALKGVRVNAGETGLEFAAPATSFLGLTDTPSSYAGQKGKITKVNLAENALEFAPNISGGFNYIPDPNGDSATDWVKAACSVAGDFPVNFSGTPTSDANLVMELETTNQLIGASSLKLNKIATSSMRGQMYYLPFTLEKGHIHTPMFIRMLASSSANMTDGEIVVGLACSGDSFSTYEWIRCTPEEIWGGQGYIQPMEFQTSGDVSKLAYRWVLYIKSTSTLAWSLVMDELALGPTSVVHGTGLWKQYSMTVTGTNWTTTRAVGVPYKTIDGTWRLKGNIRGSFSTGTLADWTVSISGVSFKDQSSVSSSLIDTLNTSDITRSVTIASTGDIRLSLTTSQTVRGVVFSFDAELNSMPAWATDYSPLLSEDAGSRSLTFEGAGNDGASKTSSQDLTWTSVRDDAASWDGSGYTPKETIDVTCSVALAMASGQPQVKLYENGSPVKVVYTALAASTNHSFSFKNKFFIGKRYSIRWSSTYTLTNNSTEHWISISKLASPQQIAASEQVKAKYRTASGQTIGTSDTVILFNSKDVDSHASYNATTGVFTTKITGAVSLVVNYRHSSGNYSGRCVIYKNGSILDWSDHGAPASGVAAINAFFQFDVVKGDYFDIRAASSSSVNLEASAQRCWFGLKID